VLGVHGEQRDVDGVLLPAAGQREADRRAVTLGDAAEGGVEVVRGELALDPGVLGHRRVTADA
jgi:hypothetical protein